jgi:cytochrome P450
MMALSGPPSLSSNPLALLREDLRSARAATVPFPPGETNFSVARTGRIASHPLPLLLDAYQRYGPVFTLRSLHQNVVFMIGPEANHFILVSDANNFTWRDGHFIELIGLLGDGLLTIDGEFHRRSRQIMLPAFHRQQLERSAEAIIDETQHALESWQLGAQLDLYLWTRRLALRIAMRAVFGLDPDGEEARRVDAAALFTQALGYYAHHPLLRILRGPHTPWARMLAARRQLDRLIYSEIGRRRRSGERGMDVLSLLLDARDDHGAELTDIQIRDEVMTLLFAGHDTTTSTVAFMFHELARHPELVQPLVDEQDQVLRASNGGEARAATSTPVRRSASIPVSGGGPTGGTARLSAAHLTGEALPQLEMVLDETLRMYPPAWIGPRRSVAPFEFAGHTVPGRAYVNYSSWVSHHLPEVFPQPERFLPSRFTPEKKAALAKGAYVPFGGGSRTCIGMRFGQIEIRAIATLILGRFTLELPEPFRLRIRQMPTIGPRDGVPVIVRNRASASARAAKLAA